MRFRGRRSIRGRIRGRVRRSLGRRRGRAGRRGRGVRPLTAGWRM